MEVCSAPHCGGLAAGLFLRPRANTGKPGELPVAPAPYPPQPQAAWLPLPPAALPLRAALPARGRRPAAWASSSQILLSSLGWWLLSHSA